MIMAVPTRKITPAAASPSPWMVFAAKVLLVLLILFLLPRLVDGRRSRIIQPDANQYETASFQDLAPKTHHSMIDPVVLVVRRKFVSLITLW